MIKIQYAEIEDVLSWMELVRFVSRNFPGLETEEGILDYEKTLIKNIHERSAICAKESEKIVGVLLFSIKNNMLSCLATHPNYRKRGVATKMLSEMLTKLDTTKDITVSTFREDDEKGIAPRALYEKFGFVEGELIQQFGHGSQIFVLHPQNSITK